MAVHERVWERGPDPRRRVQMPMRTWHPRGTYGLLIAMVAVYILQWVVAVSAPVWHNYLFAISSTWWLHPWTVVTSTFSHSLARIVHILFNGLMLFFFGAILERILGTKKFVWLFIIAGAVSGITQVTIQPGSALGASGAIMMVFGALVMIMPNEKILVWGILPVPFWAAGIGYALLDVLGALNPADGIGNFAHLSGMALGLWLGWDIRKRRQVRPAFG